MQSLEDCVRDLIDLMNSEQPLTPAPIDDIVDPYLDGSGADTPRKRAELAETFHSQTKQSERRDMIFARILKRIIP